MAWCEAALWFLCQYCEFDPEVEEGLKALSLMHQCIPLCDEKHRLEAGHKQESFKHTHTQIMSTNTVKPYSGEHSQKIQYVLNLSHTHLVALIFSHFGENNLVQQTFQNIAQTLLLLTICKGKGVTKLSYKSAVHRTSTVFKHICLSDTSMLPDLFRQDCPLKNIFFNY